MVSTHRSGVDFVVDTLDEYSIRPIFGYPRRSKSQFTDTGVGNNAEDHGAWSQMIEPHDDPISRLDVKFDELSRKLDAHRQTVRDVISPSAERDGRDVRTSAGQRGVVR